MPQEIYASLSAAEYERRYEAIWTGMRERSLDALLLYGDSSGMFANTANCTYLSGYRDRLFSYVIVVPGQEPILRISNPLYLPTARAMSHLSSIDAVSWDPGASIGADLRELGVGSGRVGLGGTAGIQTSSLPYGHMRSLADTLPAVTFDDATDLMQEVRIIKSAEEIDCLRRGAAITDATVAALEAEAQPGMSDCDLAAIISKTAFGHGGEQRTLFVGSTSMQDPDIVFPRQTPAHRVIGAGDVILMELSTEHAGYSGQIHRAMTVEAEPTPEYQQVYDVVHATYEAVLGALGPGKTDEDIRDAARPILVDSGMWTMDGLLHGWGLALEPPRLDVLDRAVIQRPQKPTVFEAGMAIVLQPHVLSEDRRRGLQLGSLVVITEDGAEALQQHPMEFLRIDGR